jgi:hypothetical protein
MKEMNLNEKEISPELRNLLLIISTRNDGEEISGNVDVTAFAEVNNTI